MIRRQLRDFPAILIIIAAAILLLSTGACGGDDIDGQEAIPVVGEVTKTPSKEAKALFQENFRTHTSAGELWRFYDTEADVYCWYIDGGYDGGLSCIPGGQLKSGGPR